jgi:hypothetical protein
MEITNISGSDVIPHGFSAEAPRHEEMHKNEQQTVNQRVEASDNNKGTTIDTYA